MIPRFRAWHKTWEEMGKVKRVRFDDEGNVTTVLFRGRDLGTNTHADEIELMQSTGLKDKNGKEIFEGDIVRVLDSTYTVFYDNERGSYRLKPHDDRWNVDYMSNFSHGGNFEVVGNIYENKEYL
jgi:hypothetical protein